MTNIEDFTTLRRPLGRVTLAILEGTGWYQVDYSQAEERSYGRVTDCDFVNG